MAYYEPGKYVCEVVEQGFGNSKEKKTPYFYLKVRPLERFVSADEREFLPTNYERDILLYVTDKTHERVIGQLRELGWQGDSWEDLDPQSGTHHAFTGQAIYASCEIEVNEDKEYERWQLPGPEGGGIQHERESNVVRNLNAMFGKALKESKPSNGNEPRQESAPPAEPARTPPDDDLPF